MLLYETDLSTEDHAKFCILEIYVLLTNFSVIRVQEEASQHSHAVGNFVSRYSPPSPHPPPLQMHEKKASSQKKKKKIANFHFIIFF